MKQPNDDRPWTAADDADLRARLARDATPEEIAGFLMRRPEEIEKRIAELARESINVFPRDIAAS